MEPIEKRVQRLEDEGAIRQVIHNYTWGVDRRLREVWLDVFADDAVMTIAPGEGIRLDPRMTKPIAGRANFEAFYDNLPPRTHLPKHVTVSSVIAVDGDRASAESYIVLFIEQDGVPDLRSTGRYYDKFRRCADGKWRITERVGYMDSLKPDTPSERSGSKA